MDTGRKKYRKIRENGLYGFIDRAQKEMIPCKWEDADNFCEGLAAVKRDGKWGLIDDAGTEVVPCQWPRLKREEDGIVIVADAVRADGAIHYGAINTMGDVLIRCAWRKELRYLGENLFCELSGERESYSLLDRDGVSIGEGFTAIARFREGMAACCIKDQYGFLNSHGQIAVPCQWKRVYDFCQGVARVTDGSHWGWIDKTGTLISPCLWDEVRNFCDGMAAVRKNGKWGYVNPNGQLTIPCEWDWAFDFRWKDHAAVVCRLTPDCDDYIIEDSAFVYILDKAEYDTFLIEKAGDRTLRIYPLCRTCSQKMTESYGSNGYVCPACGKRATCDGNRMIWQAAAPEFPGDEAAKKIGDLVPKT